MGKNSIRFLDKFFSIFDELKDDGESKIAWK